MTHTRKNPMTRDGEALPILSKGDRRRMSDGRNAWRKMTKEQRAEWILWLADEGLPIATTAGDSGDLQRLAEIKVALISAAK